MSDHTKETENKNSNETKHGENPNGIFGSARVNAQGLNFETKMLGEIDTEFKASIDAETKIAKISMCNII